MRWMLCLSALQFVFAVFPHTVQAQQWTGPGFSADMAIVDPEYPGQEMLGKMFVDKPGMRIEQTMEGERSVTIVHFAEETTLVLMPAEKAYMELPPEAMAGETESLRGLAEGDPCTVYKRSKKLGSETLQGRRTEKWRCQDPKYDDGAAGATLWYAPSLSFVVREKDDDGNEFELRNIKEGRQPAELFQVPAGYQKMAMPMMPDMSAGAVQGMGQGAPDPGGAAVSGADLPDLEKLFEGGVTEEKMKELEEMMKKLIPPE
jgi:hypothetical protein